MLVVFSVYNKQIRYFFSYRNTIYCLFTSCDKDQVSLQLIICEISDMSVCCSLRIANWISQWLSMKIVIFGNLQMKYNSRWSLWRGKRQGFKPKGQKRSNQSINTDRWVNIRRPGHQYGQQASFVLVKSNIGLNLRRATAQID